MGSFSKTTAHIIKLLMLMHMPASRDLGGPRVQLELADELRALNCDVAIMSRADVLTSRHPLPWDSSTHWFAAAAAAKVRNIASSFDVIDAHQGNLLVPKSRLRFSGLLVTRSSGLAAFYAEYERRAERAVGRGSYRALVTRPLTAWHRWESLRASVASLRLCDLVSVPNEDERRYLEHRFGFSDKTAVVHNGIEDARLATLARASASGQSCDLRVAFIGTWTPRKGCLDWPAIAHRLTSLSPAVTFSFLGTHVPRPEVLSALSLDPARVTVVESFSSTDLPSLLSGMRVGALPSYIEGFGLGVLEKMAAGIPSVAYDVPGPRETLGRVDEGLLVPVGDTEAFAAKVNEVLRLDEHSYRRLSDRCRTIAAEFSWRKIARQTLELYEGRLERVRFGLPA